MSAALAEWFCPDCLVAIAAPFARCERCGEVRADAVGAPAIERLRRKRLATLVVSDHYTDVTRLMSDAEANGDYRTALAAAQFLLKRQDEQRAREEERAAKAAPVVTLDAMTREEAMAVLREKLEDLEASDG